MPIVEDDCRRARAGSVDEWLKADPENVAAILMEGVTGSSGIILPPDDYWPRIREIADKYGILIIADEVMSGFGRTGQWFGIDNYGVQPDLITMAKGLTCGYVPLGAVAVRKKIADYFEDHPLSCGLTYSGHPVSCAAAIATIEDAGLEVVEGDQPPKGRKKGGAGQSGAGVVADESELAPGAAAPNH